MFKHENLILSVIIFWLPLVLTILYDIYHKALNKALNKAFNKALKKLWDNHKFIPIGIFIVILSISIDYFLSEGSKISPYLQNISMGILCGIGLYFAIDYSNKQKENQNNLLVSRPRTVILMHEYEEFFLLFIRVYMAVHQKRPTPLPKSYRELLSPYHIDNIMYLELSKYAYFSVKHESNTFKFGEALVIYHNAFFKACSDLYDNDKQFLSKKTCSYLNKINSNVIKSSIEAIKEFTQGELNYLHRRHEIAAGEFAISYHIWMRNFGTLIVDFYEHLIEEYSFNKNILIDNDMWEAHNYLLGSGLVECYANNNPHI